jgi:hypothetical protein
VLDVGAQSSGRVRPSETITVGDLSRDHIGRWVTFKPLRETRDVAGRLNEVLIPEGGDTISLVLYGLPGSHGDPGVWPALPTATVTVSR